MGVPPRPRRERPPNIMLKLTKIEFTDFILSLTHMVLRKRMLRSMKEGSDSGPSASMTTAPSPTKTFTLRSTPLSALTQPDPRERPVPKPSTRPLALAWSEARWSESLLEKAKITEEKESLRMRRENK